MPLYQLVVLFVYLLSQRGTQALPTPADVNVTELSRRNSYSSEPSGAKPHDFYKAVYGTELPEFEKLFKRVPHPRMPNTVKRGDFNIEGTKALYLWNNYKNADAWCMVKKKQGGFKNCRIARFSWDPPRNFNLKRFESDTEEWETFVWWNWDRYNQRRGNQHSFQRNHDWIEGPMSRTLNNGAFVADTTVGMQYAVVNGDLLKSLRFEEWLDMSSNGIPPHDEFKKKSKKPAAPAQAGSKQESNANKKKMKRAASSSGTDTPQRHSFTPISVLNITQSGHAARAPLYVTRRAESVKQAFDALVKALMESTLGKAEANMGSGPGPSTINTDPISTTTPVRSASTTAPIRSASTAAPITTATGR